MVSVSVRNIHGADSWNIKKRSCISMTSYHPLAKLYFAQILFESRELKRTLEPNCKCDEVKGGWKK